MAGAGAPVAPRPCQVTSCCRLCPGALVGLGAEVLGVLGGAVGEVLTLRLGALLGGVGAAAGHLLGDLLAPVQGLLPVLLGQTNRTLGLLLDLATAGGGIAHPGGRIAHRVAGPRRGPDHGLLGPGGGVADLALEVVHRLAHLVLGPRGHIGLVGHGLHRLAHLGPGSLYVLANLVWVLAHWTSSFTVSTVCSGTSGVACLALSRPRSARNAAIAP